MASGNPATTAAVSTDSGVPPTGDAPPGRAPSAVACEPYRELIEASLARGRDASERRFVRQLQRSAPVEARVVITTAPGEEPQVDYGEAPWSGTGPRASIRRTRLFVLTLGFSRKAVCLLVWLSAQIWAYLTRQANLKWTS